MEKQTQMIVVRQNILSNVMLKNVKLSARPEIYVVTYRIDVLTFANEELNFFM